MRELKSVWLSLGLLAGLAHGQSGTVAFQIPPVKTTIDVKGQPIEISAWGSVSGGAAGNFRVALTADFGHFQENLASVLRAHLDKSDRCGTRMRVERAELIPTEPLGLLTAHVYYERFGCAKAFGKEIVKRLVGGNALFEVELTPLVDENHPHVDAKVRKIEADGSLGEVMRSEAIGDKIREKAAESIESAIQRSANLKSVLPAEAEGILRLRSLRFVDGGTGRLWLTVDGDARFTPEQMQTISGKMAR